MLELVDELDIPKAVYTSTIAVNGDTDGEHLDESYRNDGTHIGAYDRTKWQAHYEVAEPMADDGVPVVIIQPGFVYGPGDTTDVRPIFQDYLRGELPFIPRGVAGDFEYIRNTARTHCLAMERGEPGEAYHVSGNTHTLVEVFEIAEEITGVPAPRELTPTWFRVLAPMVDIAEQVVRPPKGFESEWMYVLAGTTWLADTTKARRELGIEHRPLEEGLREYLEWEMDQLGMDGQTEQNETFT